MLMLWWSFGTIPWFTNTDTHTHAFRTANGSTNACMFLSVFFFFLLLFLYMNIFGSSVQFTLFLLYLIQFGMHSIHWNRMLSFSNLNFSLQIGIFQSRFRSKWIQINIIKMKIMLFFFCAKENWNYIDCNITYHNNLCAIIDKAPVKEIANHTSPYICI